jgi:hypothetical protein
MTFKMNAENFEELLSANLRWFDIVLYNLISDTRETYGVYDENINILDKETKTVNHMKDIFACNLNDSQLANLLCVKGNPQTRNKEISRSISRLEKAGFVERTYVAISNEKQRNCRMLIVLDKETRMLKNLWE